MKRIAPDVQIIDITHGIPPRQVLPGALTLANTLPYMPVGVHLAVVDPGVGGARRALADARSGDIILYEDAYRNVAIAISGGSAAAMFGAREGQDVRIHLGVA